MSQALTVLQAGLGFAGYIYQGASIKEKVGENG